ncbi:2-hydroxymethylglutarate dehydrogenase [Bradyrhizobium sp. Rc2d]|uniref:NAD(P)-dependent oxidoreductase n=1 Tax=Bradyrhizobium sp. Rc2d TaxID=1855321 RepID=UPI00088AD487|nr:NAD(P)-dependent oxidoreductase [Bradyrhizobium sp. Rc2d]SDJ53779.1 2-hydroxymethylglutarate dehydrogenase [Bradyrhizobium sp. Rc2d]
MEVGFIGLGMMGGHMVRHLLARGFAVHVFDVDAQAVDRAVRLGATAHRTAAAVADAAEAVSVCLPTPDIVRKVVLGKDGIIEGRKIKIYADHSTTGPSVAREVASALAERQITALDAPLAGGVAGAEAGTLSVMVSGQPWAFEKMQDAFKSFGRNVVLVGAEVGQGQSLKLVNNMIVGATLAATCEAVLFGIRCGLAPRTIVDMINASTGRSFSSEHILNKAIMTGSFDFGFRLELMRKDLRLCLAEAEAVRTPMPTCSTAKQLYDLADFHGPAGADMTEMVHMLERWASTQIRERS